MYLQNVTVKYTLYYIYEYNFTLKMYVRASMLTIWKNILDFIGWRSFFFAYTQVMHM